jgi:hypothetical protein
MCLRFEGVLLSWLGETIVGQKLGLFGCARKKKESEVAPFGGFVSKSAESQRNVRSIREKTNAKYILHFEFTINL